MLKILKIQFDKKRECEDTAWNGTHQVSSHRGSNPGRANDHIYRGCLWHYTRGSRTTSFLPYTADLFQHVGQGRVSRLVERVHPINEDVDWGFARGLGLLLLVALGVGGLEAGGARRDEALIHQAQEVVLILLHSSSLTFNMYAHILQMFAATGYPLCILCPIFILNTVKNWTQYHEHIIQIKVFLKCLYSK